MRVLALLLAAALTGGPAAEGAAAAETGAPVIALTQTACQFVEAENGVERGYEASGPERYRAVNGAIEDMRLAEARTLRLAPGRYIFRVTNRDVPYEVGFWLREHDYDWSDPIGRMDKASFAAGGIAAGETRDFAVVLAPGEYLYSCPLNPTPSYRLVVAP